MYDGKLNIIRLKKIIFGLFLFAIRLHVFKFYCIIVNARNLPFFFFTMKAEILSELHYSRNWGFKKKNIKCCKTQDKTKGKHCLDPFYAQPPSTFPFPNVSPLLVIWPSNFAFSVCKFILQKNYFTMFWR